MGPDQQFAKIRHSKNQTERANGLLENLAAVRDKQQPRLPVIAQIKPLEVKSRHHRFARSCGRHDQVSPAVMHKPLRLQRVKDPLLERMGHHVNPHKRKAAPSARMLNRIPQHHRRIRVERDEFVAVPVGFKLGDELLQNVRHVLPGHFQVPLQAARHGGMGHVRRPDIGR